MSRIIGLMVCGVGETERYLEKPLNQFKKLCDDAIICLNGEDKKRDALIKKYGFWSYRDDREWGKNQDKIKTDLLAKIVKMKPDWVLPLDADEEFAQMDRATLEGLTDKKRACYFYIVNHWNEEGKYHRGLSFWNIRFFKVKKELGLVYQKTPLHCGLAPPYAYVYGSYVPFVIRHYGLMKKEDREKKVERYKKYDPNAKYKGKVYYDAIASEPRYVATYNEGELFNKIRSDCNKMIHQKSYEH